MPDPLTLGALGALALSEGIKFLYAQAGDALKRWRERKSAGQDADEASVEPVDVTLPTSAFEGRLEEPRIDYHAVDRLESDLRDLRAAVADYAQGIDEVDPADETLVRTVDGLRRAMEVVYGQPILFKGESPAASAAGPSAVGEVEVDEVRGYVAGLRASGILGGSATGRVRAATVQAGAEAVGLEVGTLGALDRGPAPRAAGEADRPRS